MLCEGYNKPVGCKNKAKYRALIGPLPYRLCNDCYRHFVRDLKCQNGSLPQKVYKGVMTK